MPDDDGERSQFQWDAAEEELELKGKEQRRYEPWKLLLPGFVLLAAAAALGSLVDWGATAIVVVMGYAAAMQIFLCLTYALRRAEVEYLWPIERHVRFGKATDATYRARSRHLKVDLDGRQLGTDDVRDVQLRTLVSPDESKETTELFLVLAERVILVERSQDREALVEHARELRERFGVAGDPAAPRPITKAPTQEPGCREFFVPLAGGAAVAAAAHHLPALVGRPPVLAGLVVLVAAACAVSFRVYRAALRSASRLWVQREFGFDPVPAGPDARPTPGNGDARTP